MEHILYVFDDDNPVRQSIVRLLQSEGYHTVDFASADVFLSHTFFAIPVLNDSHFYLIRGGLNYNLEPGRHTALVINSGP